MDILLTGTGPATGFPVPGCCCAACSRSGGDGSGTRLPARRPTALRLPGGWWLDGGCGVHAPDGSAQRLDVGRRGEFAGFGVRAVGEDERAGLLVRVGDREAFLWAPQAGRLSAALIAELTASADWGGAGLAAVFLGPDPADASSPADPAAPTGDQPPLVECAFGLARLRGAGLLTERTQCLLVGVGHRQGQPDRLNLCVAFWGAAAPLDGTPISLERDGVAALGGRTLVLGGSASGKSALAEQLLAGRPEVVYTATGPVVDLRSNPDAEWAQRVSRHRERRPAWWQTEETHDVAVLLAKLEQPILLDSIGTWLAGVLDRSGAWQDRTGWRDRLAADTEALVRGWRARRTPLVAVTDEVGWGVVPATASGRLFRDELGRLNRRLADESERVLVVVAGRLLTDVPLVR